MAFFAIAPLLCALAQNEIKMTLYIHQAWILPAQNEVVVVKGSDDRFGETRVTDWTILDGPDPSSAKVIGHAQGLIMRTSRGTTGQASWSTSVNFVFSDERFGGSTLQILGRSRYLGMGIARDEWSIVGGTGEFTMARGVAKHDMAKINDDGSYIFKVNVHAYYSSMDSTAVFGKSGCNSKISQPIAVN